MLAELPTRRAVAQGTLPGDATEDVYAPAQYIVLLLAGESGGRLVHITVVSHFLPPVGDFLHQVGVILSHIARHVEAGRHVVGVQHIQYAGRCHGRAVLGHGHQAGVVDEVGVAVQPGRHAVNVESQHSHALSFAGPDS